jgi:hypothetical protein
LLEQLEDRLTPSTFQVGSLLDDGSAGTLRSAVEQANMNPGDDTITFDPALTQNNNNPLVGLTAGPLLLSDTAGKTTIIGPGANLLQLIAASKSNVMQVGRLVEADISGLSIIGGEDVNGGGIFNLGDLTVTAVRFSGNTGGALFNSGGTLTVTGCTFDDNRTSNPRGGAGINNNQGQVTVTNCTFVDNSADFNGGGVLSNGGTFSLANCTLVGNKAGVGGITVVGQGGGVFVQQGALSLNDTLVAGNLSGGSFISSPNDIGLSPNGILDFNSSFNLIGDANTSGRLVDNSHGNIVGNQGRGTLLIGSIVDANLGNNGGSTATLALVPGSPAIDAGDPDFDSSTFSPPLTTDQRGIGNPRKQGGRIDIGAFESAAVLPPSIPDLVAADDSGSSQTDHTTNITQSRFQGTGAPNAQVQLFVNNLPNATGLVDTLGHWLIQLSTPLADGTYDITAQQTDANGNVSSKSAAMRPRLVIDATPPAAPTLMLDPGSDSGPSSSDGITNRTAPVFVGAAAPAEVGGLILIQVSTQDANGMIPLAAPATILDNGSWSASTAERLIEGTYTVTAVETDTAGNVGPASTAFVLVVDLSGPHVVAVSPDTPVSPSPGFVDITFNEPIPFDSFAIDDRDPSFNNIHITGPDGTPTPFSVEDVAPPGQANPHNVFRIAFSTQQEGAYTFVIGPNSMNGPFITDLAGNPMNQNQNGMSGEIPDDNFTFQVAVNSTDDGRFITRIYQDLLNRQPDSADFLASLDTFDPVRFARLATIAQEYVTGSAARGQLIADLYSSTGTPPSTLGVGNLLRRAPSTAEVDFWLSQLAAGTPVEEIINSVIASKEYFDLNSDDNGQFIDRAYSDLLGHLPDQLKRAQVLNDLVSGRSTRLSVTQMLTSSAEYRDHLIAMAYHNLLPEDHPGAADIANWENVLSSASAGPAEPTRDEQLLIGLLASRSYFYIQTDSTGLHTNQSWVDSLYASLRIPVNAAEASSTLNRLVNDYAPERLTAVAPILVSNEYVTMATDRAFVTYLGMSPPPDKLAYWQQQFQGGMTQEDQTAVLMGSDEYLARTPIILGTAEQPSNDTFVRAAYRQLFPNYTATQAEINSIVNAIGPGGPTRQDVAKSLLTSDRYRFDVHDGLVTRHYIQYLGRPATFAEIAFWKSRFQGSFRDKDLIAALLDTSEYFLGSTGAPARDTTPPAAPTLSLDPASDTGASSSDGITQDNRPTFVGAADPAEAGGLIEVSVQDESGTQRVVATATILADGSWIAPFSGDSLSDGTYSVTAVETDTAGNVGDVARLPFNLQVIGAQPARLAAPALLPADDSQGPTAMPGDHLTNVTRPRFTGTAQANATIQIVQNYLAAGTSTVIGQGTTDANGTYTVQIGPGALGDGTYDISARQIDGAGNVSASPTMTPPLVVDTIQPQPPTLMLDPSYDIVVGDNITASIPQLFEGTTEAGTQVAIQDGAAATTTVQQLLTPTTFNQILHLGNGTHMLTVVATDLAGNSTGSQLTVVIAPDALDPDRKYIRALYLEELGRPGSLAEWSVWGSELALLDGRRIVSSGIATSREARVQLVDGWYLKYLGRTAGDWEDQAWVKALLDGASEEQVLGVILSSEEYFNHTSTLPSASGLSPNQAFVEALYVQLLGRQADAPGLKYWTDHIGDLGRDGVARQLLSSREYRDTIVRGYYRDLVQRPAGSPSQQEVDSWSLSGMDITSIRVGFLASKEYYDRATGFRS